MVANSLIQSSLEIGVPHINEMITSQYAAGSDSMLHENAEYLESYFLIRLHFAASVGGDNCME